MIEQDELLLGSKMTWSIYGPAALKLEIERQATLDGYGGRKLAPYMVELLLLGLREREKQREKQASKKK